MMGPVVLDVDGYRVRFAHHHFAKQGRFADSVSVRVAHPMSGNTESLFQQAYRG